MTRISSVQTVLMKRVFPVSIAATLAVVGYLLLRDPPPGRVPMYLIVMAIMLANLIVYWTRVRGVADEVSDGGNYLLVRKGGIEERVALADIASIESGRFVNPPRMTLRLRKPGKLGGEIAFIPQAAFQFNPFARHPLVESLSARIERARPQA